MRTSRFPVLLVIIAALVPVSPVSGQDIDEDYLDERLGSDAILSRTRDESAATDARLNEASSQLSSLALTATQLEAEIAALDVSIGSTRRRYEAELAAQADAVRAQAALVESVASAQLDYDAWDALITERAVSAYIRPVRTPSFIPLLQSGSLTELERKIVLLDAVAVSDQELLDGLEAARLMLELELERQIDAEDTAASSRERVAESLDRLSSARIEQAELQEQLDGEIAAFEAEIDALEATRAELERVIATREAHIASEAQQRAAWRADCSAGRTPIDDDGIAVDCAALDEPVPPSSMQWPSAGVVSSEFGERWGRMHDGIDIAAGVGTPIAAAEHGAVFFAGWLGGYGNTVMIDHGAGIMTLYGHMSELWVTNGVSVSIGQGIGAMGSTGNSTGPHLHFEVRIDGGPVDPRQFLG
ncbi:MAG: peptidoglycan DD-metalloendopeptidase family protein [Acidimicrobiia bacterium]|nr:peptidoglycan DD-metalloendopeptidase family protein [Acidimicrobiia bacterium]